MKIPIEVVMSPIKGGCFEWDAKRRCGWWWKGGKLIADWRIGKASSVVVNWYGERSVAREKNGPPQCRRRGIQ